MKSPESAPLVCTVEPVSIVLEGEMTGAMSEVVVTASTVVVESVGGGRTDCDVIAGVDISVVGECGVPERTNE